MKEYRSETHTKRLRRLRLYAVSLCCAAMLGGACFFAYRQTTQDVRRQMQSQLSRVQEIPAGKRETSVTKPETTARQTTAAVTAASTEAAGLFPKATTTVTETAPLIEPTETAAPETAAPTEETAPATEAPRGPQWPVYGEILQEFSGGELVKSPTTGVWQTHNGVDVAAALGDTVCAMDAGVVCAVEEDALWGFTVTVDHRNGIFSRYCNLNAGVAVTEGETVACGAVLGAVGDSADAESALPTHLHFEVMQGETYIDPVTYIN